MKLSNIKCNGTGYESGAQSLIPTFETLTSVFRMRFKKSEIFKKFLDYTDYHAGERFTSNNSVAIRIVSALVGEARRELRTDDAIIIEGYITAFVDSLSGSEIDSLIINSMEDCASADYYFKKIKHAAKDF